MLFIGHGYTRREVDVSMGWVYVAGHCGTIIDFGRVRYRIGSFI